MPYTLLLVFAHPDDESVFAAGVACRCADEGGRVALVTATLGEEGKRGDPPVCAPEDLGRVRQAEVEEAVRILGIDRLHLLGHRDRALAAVSPATIREQLVRVVRQERPDVVLTFDPNGSNLHPDHVAISRFTSDAIAAAGDPRWLPDAGAAHRVRRLLWTLPARPWEVLRRGDPAAEAGVDVIVDVSRWAERKARALRAHRSQHLSTERIFFSKQDADRLLAVELFRQAWGRGGDAWPMRDVFEGL